MNILCAIFTFIATPLVLLFLAFSVLLLRLFLGKSIRNPKYPPVIGTVFHQLFYFNSLYDYQTEQAKTWPTFRLLTPDQSDIYTTDTRNIEHILKTNFDKYSKAVLFSEEMLPNWLELFLSFLRPSRVFDVQDLLMRCTLDSMFKVGFGVDLNCLEGSSKQGSAFIRAFDDSNALVYWRYVDPLWKLKRFLNVGSEASLKKNVKVIDDFVNDLIKRKRKQLAVQQDSCLTDYKNDKEDILSRFLMESKKDPEGMNDQYLRDIILSFMIAGKDTSANTLSWFFYMLCKNPLIQEKVAQEVREVTSTQENGASVNDFVTSISEEVLEKMHYLHSALTETLRLYPAVPVDGRCVETDDTLPDGFKLKKGDGVYYISYAMGRMQYIWGDDAEDYRPERWLNNGIFQPESPFKFIAFHAGPRICLGKDFAYRQMKIMAMALLRFFRFKLADETKNVTYRTMFTLHINGGLHLCAVPRTVANVYILTKLLREKSGKRMYHPIARTIFNQRLNFNSLHHYMTDLAGKHRTYWLISSFRNEIYISDPANVDYILKTNFENCGKV
ncbi:cytochrome P450, family 704, subfamily A, polypeptide 2 [Actinidia rufa]|uniref:Cytochrome P450, family 704, subfamily A, polypeptide 2 n=1 Tax=Actinidia rufa TaxID=165716 RepID=A0A7J0EU21_9ERIC|nr:cytochrome P450, family 704, subfamily A, polypeptide 2 [Actinidia rufa]